MHSLLHLKCRFSKWIRSSGSSRLFGHVPLKIDQLKWSWGIRLNDIPTAIGCNHLCTSALLICPSPPTPPPSPPHLSFSVALPLSLTCSLSHTLVYTLSVMYTSLYTYDSQYAECSVYITYTTHVPVYINQSCLYIHQCVMSLYTSRRHVPVYVIESCLVYNESCLYVQRISSM